MSSDMKSIVFAFIIIIIFSEGKLQSRQNLFLDNFLNSFFPKEPGLVKVRRMDRTKGMNNAKILDFVSKKFFLIKFIRILYSIYYWFLYDKYFKLYNLTSYQNYRDETTISHVDVTHILFFYIDWPGRTTWLSRWRA